MVYYYYQEYKAQSEKWLDIEMTFRIGGDEFALITGSKDLSYVEDLSREVLSHNGEYVSWENQKIPLSLRAGIHQVPENNLKYDDFYSGMHKAIEECRRQEQIVKKVWGAGEILKGMIY